MALAPQFSDREKMFLSLQHCQATSPTATLLSQKRIAHDIVRRLTPEQAEERAMQVIGERLTKDDMFSFSCLPMLIARFVWDRVETITDLACSLQIPTTKRLCRTLNELRRQFYTERRNLLSSQIEKHEDENMHVFEDATKDLEHKLTVGLRRSITAKYPQLQADYVYLLIAVYQCLAVYDALLTFEQQQRDKVSRKLRRPAGHVLPKQFLVIRPLIEQFSGDKPLSERYLRKLSEYSAAYVRKMYEITYNDNPPA